MASVIDISRRGALALPARASRLLARLARVLVMPLTGIFFFLVLWSAAAERIDTSLGRFPGPADVLRQSAALYAEHQTQRAERAAFHERQAAREAQRQASDPSYVPRTRAFTGKPTFVDQIRTSLVTVGAGFALAALIGIPLGIAIGLSPALGAAMTPLIQLFRPVSPLAWLPLVTMVVSAVHTASDPLLSKSFVNSALTVALCCVWPMVINAASGVATLDRDLLDVSRVLRLGPLTHLRKVLLPAAVPMIFIGMRLALGIAWMVLIAAEMLAQNPGLGKFVWDEFQNGSSDSLGRIMVAVLVIGFIGFLLDRAMLTLQRAASWDKRVPTR